MDGGFFSDLEFFSPTDKPASSVAVPSIASQPIDCPGLGIYPNEESVDLSSWIIEVCDSEGPVPSPSANTARRNYHEPPSVVHIPTNSYSFGNFTVPSLPTSAPTVDMYDNNGSDLNTHQVTTLPPHSTLPAPKPSSTSLVVTPDSTLVASRPAPGKAPRKSKKGVDKASTEYRVKRNRNNVAVRKSREKSRMRVAETELRVKELEEENTQLQSKITLLTKELNVLKGLFASAGVTQPASSFCVKEEFN